MGGFIRVCLCSPSPLSSSPSAASLILLRSRSQISLRSNKLEEAEEDVSLTLDSLLVLNSLAGAPSSDLLSSDKLRPLFPPEPGVSFSGSRTRFLPTARRLFFCLVAGICFFSSSVKVMLETSGPMNWNAGFLPLPSVT